MSEHQPRCPRCGKLDTETVLIHDPKTYALNTKATLRCRSCEARWEGLVTSPIILAAQSKGWIL